MFLVPVVDVALYYLSLDKDILRSDWSRDCCLFVTSLGDD